jgi:SAM-dependent methyltransferase
MPSSPPPAPTSTPFRDLFSTAAERYARFRPRYPAALVDALVAACPQRQLAWDAGCGNGQLTIALAPHFARVVATDPSRSQLDAAEHHAHVEYRCERAEATSLEDGSVDLAVVAQAAHWFDWPAYVAEVGRVARPGALVATISYGNCRIDRAAATEIVDRFYAELAPYWSPERAHVENAYRDLTWPWPTVDAPALDMVESWTRDEFCGYLGTWSAVLAQGRVDGGARYADACAELARVWPDGERRAVRWPLAIRFARR